MVVGKVKSKLERNAIRLPSSGKVYGHDDESFVEDTLTSLLAECYERKLRKRDKIIVTDEYLDEDKMPEDCNNPEDYLKCKKNVQYVRNLYDTYEQNYGRKYSPENERERKGFNMEVMERRAQGRAAWGLYAALVRESNEIREEQEAFKKGGEEAVEKLREGKRRKGNFLVIG